MLRFIVLLALATAPWNWAVTPSRDDDFAIFRAVLDHYSADYQNRHRIEARRLIHDHSAFILLEHDQTYLPRNLRPDLREAWIKRNREPQWIGDFTVAEPHVVVPGRALGKRFLLAAPDSPRLHYYDHDVLRRDFPLFQGILELTLPGYSSDGTEAFVYLWTGCGNLCADGRVYQLCKINGHWQVVSAAVVWVS